MIHVLSLVFAMQVSSAATLNPLTCFGLLESKPAIAKSESERNFQIALAEIRRAGADDLLAPLERGEIQTDFKNSRLAWQSMVSGRVGWLGKKSLIVRGFGFGNELEKQKVIWRTATVLFELQVRSSLWSRSSLLTSADLKRFDLSLEGGLDSLKYFISTQPREWRDEKLRQIEKLETELYSLFSSLNLLKAENILPEKDPGRFWVPRLAVGSDGIRPIAPNQEDYAVWQRGAALGIQQRHSRNVLYNYYMNFVKRALVLTFAVQVAVVSPDIMYLPSYMDAMFSYDQFTQELNKTPEKAEEYNRRYIDNLQKTVRQEEKRLKTELQRLQRMGNSDQEELRSTEQELRDLYESYPWLVHPPR